MISQLSVDIVPTGDVKTLRIEDSSWYNKKVDVECPTLEVTTPGTTRAIIFTVKEAFSIVLNSSNLKLKRANVYSDLGPLPDGIYHIKYSIKPNDKLWIEYDWLRIESLVSSLNKKRADLKLQPCALDTVMKQRLEVLNEVEVFIKAAKGEVEYRHNRIKGLELYNYAKSLLNKFNQTNCLTC